LFGLSDHWESQIASDESELGMSGRYHSGIVGTFLHWSKSGVTAAHLATQGVNWANWVRSRTGVPMLNLMPGSEGHTLAEMANGSDDYALGVWARELHRWGHPFLLRLFPEMNGGWETYSPNGHSGMTSTSFRAAWRHIYWLFRTKNGATNVEFIWNPDRYFKGEHYSYADLWPGAGYVQWIGIDFYNWADTVHGTYWPYYLAYDSVQRARALSGASTKPLMVPEVGCAPYRYKSQWIDRMASDFERLGILATVWFDEHPSGHPNWRLDSSYAVKVSARNSFGPYGSHSSNVVYYPRVSMTSIDRLVATGVAPWS
jgi:endoglucanase